MTSFALASFPLVEFVLREWVKRNAFALDVEGAAPSALPRPDWARGPADVDVLNPFKSVDLTLRTRLGCWCFTVASERASNPSAVDWMRDGLDEMLAAAQRAEMVSAIERFFDQPRTGFLGEPLE